MKTTHYIALSITATLGIAFAALLLRRHTGRDTFNTDGQAGATRSEAEMPVLSERPARNGGEAVALPALKHYPSSIANTHPNQLTQSTTPSSQRGAPPAREMPESVKTILNPEVEFSKRIDAVHSLSRNLDTEELDSLFEFLADPVVARSPERLEHWLRNDVMDKLVVQQTAPEGLADLLVAIYEDRQQDIVMRDYAVQHMPVAYGKMSDEEQASLEKAMWHATEETESSIAGTALLALMEVTGRSCSVATASTPAQERARLAETALKLASDDHCGELARITAVSICGRMGVKQVLPIATQLADSADSMPLRIAAIAALGDVGETAAANLLQHFSTGSDARLRPAAAAALQRLQERNGS